MTIENIYNIPQNKLKPIDQFLQDEMVESDDINGYSSENKLYHNIQQLLLDIISLTEKKPIQPIIKTEIIETCCLQLYLIGNYTNIQLIPSEYYMENEYQKTPDVFTTGSSKDESIEEFTDSYTDSLPKETKQQFAKNRQKTVQDVFIELLVTTYDIGTETAKEEIERKIAIAMLTIEKSYTTQTFISHNLKQSEIKSKKVCESSDINIKTL